MRIGYARVSTLDRTPTLQRDALEAAGCESVFTDHGSSGTATARPGLDRAMKDPAMRLGLGLRLPRFGGRLFG
jgi:DNA invertase Pin-like site-specific DNA recombinase